ncbi:unnamed protein product [Chondrus crispus]|uniref:Uncharacterized protein n=1 Tax=Chondrus crispus TaxID=2769 RepID=R7Q2E4_CHOCR|nr:unnamed protein product [Chondrus crispus]CDF32762.1 unnamed protein product [Chondrus crispus]|eukprot:XP_005712563.1 unnamed protein product [Chondrus crispus]
MSPTFRMPSTLEPDQLVIWIPIPSLGYPAELRRTRGAHVPDTLYAPNASDAPDARALMRLEARGTHRPTKLRCVFGTVQGCGRTLSRWQYRACGRGKDALLLVSSPRRRRPPST